MYLIALLFFSTNVYSQKSTQNYKEENLNFISYGNKISGKLITPQKQYGNKMPVIVFVHGSGPENYSSSDNYRYMWEQFTKIGFACYSWDRPGVGNSEGKWFELGIKERAAETISAVNMLKMVDKIDSIKIGFWGISQAGWVIPEIAASIKPAFVIEISSPVTTIIKEEIYRVKARMGAGKFSRNDINNAISYTKNLKRLVDKNRPYEEFVELQNKIKNAKWADYVGRGDETIYQYLTALLKEDKEPDLDKLKCPVLAIWGANDLVVPPKESAIFFKRRMSDINNPNVIVKIIPDADHTITFNLTGKGSETIKRREFYKNNPAEIFAPGYIISMTTWLKDLGLND